MGWLVLLIAGLGLFVFGYISMRSKRHQVPTLKHVLTVYGTYLGGMLLAASAFSHLVN